MHATPVEQSTAACQTHLNAMKELNIMCFWAILVAFPDAMPVGDARRWVKASGRRKDGV